MDGTHGVDTRTALFPAVQLLLPQSELSSMLSTDTYPSPDSTAVASTRSSSGSKRLMVISLPRSRMGLLRPGLLPLERVTQRAYGWC